MSDSQVADAFREAFRNSKHIIVVAGAGLSAASGIPTFRDGGGMWRSLDAADLATPEAFTKNPSLVWQFYHYRRTKALQARANPAHEVIAKMSVPSYLKKVAPAAESFHLVTQNVDRLSVAALDALVEKHLAPASASASSPTSDSLRQLAVFPNSIIEMHGRIYDVKCTSCDYCAEDRTDPLCPALGVADASFQDYHDAGSKEVKIPEEQLPRCPACGALARPGVVWFGEELPHLGEIESIVLKADMCLVVGTSSTVSPARDYPYDIQDNGGMFAVFNLDPSEEDQRADFVFPGGCESVLPSLFPELA